MQLLRIYSGSLNKHFSKKIGTSWSIGFCRNYFKPNFLLFCPFLFGFYHGLSCLKATFFPCVFQSPLPWHACPVVNGTVVKECDLSSSTAYFWYRETLDATESIGDFGGVKWWMAISLIAAWTLVYFCIMKGIESSGKVSKYYWIC